MAHEPPEGHTPRPRHAADPWWLDSEDAAEQTHVLRRADLDAAEPTTPVQARRSAGWDDLDVSQDVVGADDHSTSLRHGARRVARPEPDAEAADPVPTGTPARASRDTSTSERGASGPKRADSSPRPADHPSSDRDRRFRRAAWWTVAAAVVPGLGLSRSRVSQRRTVGWVIVGLVIAAGLTGVVMAVARPAVVASVAVRPRFLHLITWGLPVLAVGLVALLTFTHLDLRPRRITRGQRWISSILVGALSLMITAPMAVASRYAHDEAAMLAKIFADRRSGTRPDIDTNRSVADIWRDKPRLNVLLVGADDGRGRNYRAKGEMNTDTMMVASIDTHTANTTIIQIPRNTAALPFPPDSPLHKIYPDGFTDGHGDNSDYFASALWSTVQNEHADAMGATDYPGADALKLAMGQALGLPVDYFVMVDIDGLQKLIDALGGVTVNVNERLPIASNTEGKKPTGWIEQGPDQHLDGYRAMWYARSRATSSDYARMGRQSCLMKAVLDQANPSNVLARFESIASASGDMVVSDIPQGMLPAFVDLAIRMRDANLNRLLFVNGRNGFKPYDPNYPLMREQVAQAIADVGATKNRNKPVTGASAVRPSASPSASPGSSPSATASPNPSASGPSGSPSPTAVGQSVTDECAYHPQS